jgi:hypothetical protein
MDWICLSPGLSETPRTIKSRPGSKVGLELFRPYRTRPKRVFDWDGDPQQWPRVSPSAVPLHRENPFFLVDYGVKEMDCRR